MIRLRAGILGCLTILTFLTAHTFLTPHSVARAQSLTAAQVEQGIGQAIRYFLSNQLPDGGWPEFSPQYPDGVSTLVTLALLNSGMEPNRPEIAKALQFISRRKLERTYTVSVQTMALCAANPNKYANQIQSNAQWLIDAQLANGGWGYGARDGGTGDPSNSQFALLALHEAQRSGVCSVSVEHWSKVFGEAEKYWHRLQNRDGSFPYDSGGNAPGRGSMTCAGIASLVIVGSQLDSLGGEALDRVQCCGEASQNQARIAAALKWLGDNLSLTSNPGHLAEYLYYMYALERAGRLTGRRFIGEADWYRQGSLALLQLQDKITGRIVARNAYNGNDVSETAFALLFLAKGKRQTVINRLQYGSDNDWNNHPAAIQHLTTFTEQAWKRELSWQNVELDKATVKDLLEAPVLFFSGSRVPVLTAKHKLILKEYVQQGGFIFAEACNGDGCDGKAFEDFFNKLMLELFDKPLEKLSPDHPIWFAETRVAPQDLPHDAWLYGVQTCCRLGVVYSPISLSCRWQLNQPFGAKLETTPTVQKDLDASTKIGINVLAYVTGRELKQKLDTVTVLEEVRNQLPTDRGVFLLPKLQHNAGANDASQAVPNLIKWLDKENPFQLSSENRVIEISRQELKKYPVAFMHGRGELRLTELQRDALREYFKNSGFLFVDAICADQAFAESFRREMALVLESPLSKLPESHALLTREFGGFDIREVTVIDPDLSGDSINAAQRRLAPRLEFGSVDNRIAVVFSPLDISCALESRHSLQCRGYVRDDAARIGINVVLFALQSQ